MIFMTDKFNIFQAAQEGAALPSIGKFKEGEAIKSPEELRRDWLMLRRGKFTASGFHRLMASPDKDELPKGGKTCALEKALELMSDFQPDSYISPAMQWGLDHEQDAIGVFMDRFDLTVVAHGDGQAFLQLGPDIGGTPDGLIPLVSSGIEVKCPNSKTHLKYLEIVNAASLKAIAPEYYWQCQGLMMINNSDCWYFVSYDPRFLDENLQMHVAIIFRHPEDIERLRIRLDMAIEERDYIIAKYRK